MCSKFRKQFCNNTEILNEVQQVQTHMKLREENVLNLTQIRTMQCSTVIVGEV